MKLRNKFTKLNRFLILPVFGLIIAISGNISAQNNCLDFPGTDDYVDVAGYKGVTGGNSRTYEAWIRASPDQTGTNYIISTGKSGAGKKFDLALSDWGTTDGAITAHTSASYICGRTNLRDDTWHHVAIRVFDDGSPTVGEIMLYIDGVVEEPQTTNNPSQSINTDATGNDMRIGIYNEGGSAFDGLIDEVRIWDDKRTGNEIRSNLFKEISDPSSEANLIVYYKFNESDGSTTATDTKESYNGSLSNMTGNEWEPSPAFFGPKNCLDFDGIDDYIFLPGAGPPAVRTVELWIYPANTTDSLLQLNATQFIRFNSGTLFAEGFTSPTLYVNGEEATGISASEWQHIAVTTATGINASDLDIGRHGSNYFEGKVDEFRLWDDVRTQEEIVENMCNSLTGNEAGLITYYIVDKNNSMYTQDYSGNNYNGVLSYLQASDDLVNSAAFNTWLNTTSTDWSDTSNWSLKSTPVLTDHVGLHDHGGSSTDPSIDEAIAVDNLVVGDNVSLTYNYSGSHTIHGNAFNIGHTTLNDNTFLTITGSLFMLHNSSLDINPGADLTIDKNLYTSILGLDGTLTLKSSSAGTGSLIVEGTATGNATIQRYLPDGGWHSVAPSTGSVTANDFFYDDDPKSWLTYHTESMTTNGGWTYNLSLGTSMPLGQGWMVWIENSRENVTSTMTGTLQTTDKTVELTATLSSPDTLRWNFIGNPFACAIDRDNGTWGTNTTGAVYVWDNDYSGGTYLTYTPGSGGSLTEGIIPISQGFFVRANIDEGGSYTIPAASRIHNTTNFYKAAEKIDRPFVRLALTTQDYISEVFVGFHENCSWQFDNNYDADKLYGNTSSPQMIIPEDGRELCNNGTPPLCIEEDRIIPLHVKYFIDGNYTLSISDLENLPDVNIHLEDLRTGTIHNFTDGQDYQFNANKDDDPERFLLHFKSMAFGINDFSADTDNITIYSANQSIYIHSKGPVAEENGVVKVFNILGLLCLEQEIDGIELISIPVYISNNYFIVKVIKPSGVKTEKVYIN